MAYELIVVALLAILPDFAFKELFHELIEVIWCDPARKGIKIQQRVRHNAGIEGVRLDAQIIQYFALTGPQVISFFLASQLNNKLKLSKDDATITIKVGHTDLEFEWKELTDEKSPLVHSITSPRFKPSTINDREIQKIGGKYLIRIGVTIYELTKHSFLNRCHVTLIPKEVGLKIFDLIDNSTKWSDKIDLEIAAGLPKDSAFNATTFWDPFYKYDATPVEEVKELPIPKGKVLYIRDQPLPIEFLSRGVYKAEELMVYMPLQLIPNDDAFSLWCNEVIKVEKLPFALPNFLNLKTQSSDGLSLLYKAARNTVSADKKKELETIINFMHKSAEIGVSLPAIEDIWVINNKYSGIFKVFPLLPDLLLSRSCLSPEPNLSNYYELTFSNSPSSPLTYEADKASKQERGWGFLEIKIVDKVEKPYMRLMPYFYSFDKKGLEDIFKALYPYLKVFFEIPSKVHSTLANGIQTLSTLSKAALIQALSIKSEDLNKLKPAFVSKLVDAEKVSDIAALNVIQNTKKGDIIDNKPLQTAKVEKKKKGKKIKLEVNTEKVEEPKTPITPKAPKDKQKKDPSKPITGEDPLAAILRRLTELEAKISSPPPQYYKNKQFEPNKPQEKPSWSKAPKGPRPFIGSNTARNRLIGLYQTDDINYIRPLINQILPQARGKKVDFERLLPFLVLREGKVALNSTPEMVSNSCLF